MQIKAGNLDFKVFNRWGQLVFHSRDWTIKWDGKLNGRAATNGCLRMDAQLY
jgi:hypothetical protein